MWNTLSARIVSISISLIIQYSLIISFAALPFSQPTAQAKDKWAQTHGPTKFSPAPEVSGPGLTGLPDEKAESYIRRALGRTETFGAPVDRREDLNTASGRADSRLNHVTMPMGNLLRNGIGFMELAQWIRDDLCEKPSQGRGVP